MNLREIVVSSAKCADAAASQANVAAALSLRLLSFLHSYFFLFFGYIPVSALCSFSELYAALAICSHDVKGGSSD